MIEQAFYFAVLFCVPFFTSDATKRLQFEMANKEAAIKILNRQLPATIHDTFVVSHIGTPGNHNSYIQNNDIEMRLKISWNDTIFLLGKNVFLTINHTRVLFFACFFRNQQRKREFQTPSDSTKFTFLFRNRRRVVRIDFLLFSLVSPISNVNSVKWIN